MPIKLDWIDHNVSADSRKVYRSTSKIDVGNLGVPLAVLAGNALTYTDDTVQRNVTYHYVVTSVQGADEAPSAEFVIAYIPYTGPGPQTLLRGNWEYGYFGRAPLEDIFSYGEFIAACDMTALCTANTATGNYWHKVVYKGKILFFPNNHIASAVQWQSLYQKGLVYGAVPSANWPAAVKTSLGTIEQGKVVASMNHRFIVRLPTSRETLGTTGTTSALLRGGEIDKVFAALYLNREFNTDALPQMDDSSSTIGTATHRLTADYHSGTSPVNVVTRTCISTNGNIDSVQATALAANNGSGAVQWTPVLELQV